MPKHKNTPSKWPSWKEAETFTDWVIRMIKTKRTQEPEFQSALNYWGRAKIEKIWKDYLDGKKKP